MKLSGAAAGAALAAPELAVASSDKPDLSRYDDDWGMLNDEYQCTGCKTCQYVCKKRMGFDNSGDIEYYDNPRDLNARNYTVVKLYKGEGEYSYVKKNCMHCNDPACVSACPVRALVKRDDGPVVYDPSKCIGCRYCMIACPFDVPKFEYESATPEIRKCDLCVDIVTDESRTEKDRRTLCSATCPRDAIITGRRKDLIKEAWRRINEKPDIYQHHVYGEYEVGGTAVMYISHVEFDKIGFQPFEATAIPRLPESIQHGIFKYWVTPLALFGMLAIVRGSQMKCDPYEDEECIEV